jgi:hypothetical protein
MNMTEYCSVISEVLLRDMGTNTVQVRALHTAHSGGSDTPCDRLVINRAVETSNRSDSLAILPLFCRRFAAGLICTKNVEKRRN